SHELRLRAQHLDAADRAFFERGLDHLEVATIVVHELLDGCDFSALRRNLDRLQRDVAGDGELRRLRLPRFILRERLLLLDRARYAAKEVQRIAHGRAERVVSERRRRRETAEKLRAEFLPADPGGQVD